MRPILLLAAVVLASVPARAEIFVARDAFRFSLSRSVVTGPEDGEGELDVTAMGVRARFGARRASRTGAFEDQEVTVLGEPYDVRDGVGGRWRMVIRSAVKNAIVVELVRARRIELPAVETYRAVSILIDGAEASLAFADLSLFDDGTYRLGLAHGHYRRDEFSVTLEGIPGYLERGTAWLDHDGVTFKYLRGTEQFVVQYQLINQNIAGR